jgi:hypothetical protein
MERIAAAPKRWYDQDRERRGDTGQIIHSPGYAREHN